MPHDEVGGRLVALEDHDPRKIAAVVIAAECWRWDGLALPRRLPATTGTTPPYRSARDHPPATGRTDQLVRGSGPGRLVHLAVSLALGVAALVAGGVAFVHHRPAYGAFFLLIGVGQALKASTSAMALRQMR